MRLAAQIGVEGLECIPPTNKMREALNDLEDVIRKGPMIEATFASDRVEDAIENRRWDGMEKAFDNNGDGHYEPKWREQWPCVAPPFDSFWVEYFGKRGFVASNPPHGRTGLACYVGFDRKKVENGEVSIYPDVYDELIAKYPTVRWVMFCMPVFAVSGKKPVMAHWIAMFMIDGEGGFVLREESNNPLCWAPLLKGEPWEGIINDAVVVHGALIDTVLPLFECLKIMHCKNVKLESDGSNGGMKERERKKFKQTFGDKCEAKYYELVVDDGNGKKIKLSSQNTTPPGNGRIGVGYGDNALHVVRGNFATYSDDRPLFGRLVGTFFRPSHMRGVKNCGVVKKDYRVGR